MTRAAASLLAEMPPVTITLGRVLYHPEAIMLALRTPRRSSPSATQPCKPHDWPLVFRRPIQLRRAGPPTSQSATAPLTGQRSPHRRTRLATPQLRHPSRRTERCHPVRPQTHLELERHRHRPPLRSRPNLTRRVKLVPEGREPVGHATMSLLRHACRIQGSARWRRDDCAHFLLGPVLLLRG
jgi:hypothetical protein